MKGIVSDIQRFSVHDGPGIRTTVFLKGCNLGCHWCHNPETLRPGPELQLFPSKCIGCGTCLEVCPQSAHERLDEKHVFHRELCVACGACARSCYAQAIVLIGQEMSAEEVVAEVLEDAAFYRDSSGGVTISGGEPLLQRDFTREVLSLCRSEGIHTAIESNMAWPWDYIAPILPLADLVMMDIKTMSAPLHEEWAGAPNARILDNAIRLSREPRPLIVRTPVIPGMNDTPEEIGQIAAFISSFPNLEYYELLPYHPLGSDKYRSLGIECRMDGVKPPGREEMHTLAEVAREQGVQVRAGGS